MRQWLIVWSCPVDWERARLCGNTVKAEADTGNSLRTSRHCAGCWWGSVNRWCGLITVLALSYNYESCCRPWWRLRCKQIPLWPQMVIKGHPLFSPGSYSCGGNSLVAYTVWISSLNPTPHIFCCLCRSVKAHNRKEVDRNLPDTLCVCVCNWRCREWKGKNWR